MSGEVLAIAIVAVGLVGLAIAFVRNERAQRGREGTAPAPAAPRVLRLSVVDIGPMRYFDVRTFPLDAFVGRAATDGAANAVRGRAPAQAHVWVMPRGLERWLGELEPAALAIVLSRLRDPAHGAAAQTFVWVEGWTPPPGELDTMARELGIELLLALPRLIEPDRVQAGLPERDVLGMLDEAARGSARVA